MAVMSDRPRAAVHWYSHATCLGHDPGAGHRERPERLAAVITALEAGELAARLRRREPRPAPREALLRVHDAAYVNMIMALRGASSRLDADTVVSPGSVDAALHAAGAALDAAAAVLGGGVRSALCAVRPPGHHAERDRAMGLLPVQQRCGLPPPRRWPARCRRPRPTPMPLPVERPLPGLTLRLVALLPPVPHPPAGVHPLPEMHRPAPYPPGMALPLPAPRRCPASRCQRPAAPWRRSSAC